jgi:polygalacturonase
MKTMMVSLLAFSSVAFAAATVCDVRDYGASGNGKTKDTQAVQKAIEACAQKGAGVVYFPPGSYLIGNITLRSNLTLHLEAGATLLASPDVEDYPLLPSAYQPEIRRGSALIYGEGLENVTITGLGTIDGQGLLWYRRSRMPTQPVVHDFHNHHLANSPGQGDYYFQGKPTKEEADKVAQHGRPWSILLVHCTNILMQGFTIRNSPDRSIDLVFGEQVVLRGLTIDNPMESPTTDAMDIESCRNVHIDNCTMGAGDDLVTIKSGTEPAGLRINRPTENVTVTNCTMLHGHGAIVFGSETSGGARNITVSNCVFRGTDRGFRLKTQRGRGGVVDGLVASNIVMEDVYEPFRIIMYYDTRSMVGFTPTRRPIPREGKQPVTEGTPVWRNLSFDNILARGATTAGIVLGLAESPYSGITFSNVRVWAKEEGFYCRFAKDVAFHNVQINTEAGSALVVRDVDGLEIDGFRTAEPHPEAPVIDLNSITDAFLRGSWAAPGTGTFLNVSGESTRNVMLNGNDLRYAKQAVNVGKEAAQEVRVQ